MKPYCKRLTLALNFLKKFSFYKQKSLKQQNLFEDSKAVIFLMKNKMTIRKIKPIKEKRDKILSICRSNVFIRSTKYSRICVGFW